MPGTPGHGLRAHSHYVKFGLTRLRFSKFPWQRKKNGENAASNALASTQRRGLRWRRCVCIFCVSCRLMTSTTIRWVILGGQTLMSNHSHTRVVGKVVAWKVVEEVHGWGWIINGKICSTNMMFSSFGTSFSVDDRVEMALSTRRKKILAWYLLEASDEFLRTLLEKVVDEEPLLDERSLRKRRPRRHEEEGDKLVQALLLCSADQRLLRRLIADRLKRRF